jgi:hypothetical protein
MPGTDHIQHQPTEPIKIVAPRCTEWTHLTETTHITSLADLSGLRLGGLGSASDRELVQALDRASEYAAGPGSTVVSLFGNSMAVRTGPRTAGTNVA